MTEPMNPNCKTITWANLLDGSSIVLSPEEVATLKAAVPEFLRNTTMEADHELLVGAARIIDRITKE